VRGARLRFRFRGKSGVEHRIELADRRLAAIVRRMQDLPGEELFRYVDDDGVTRTIESDDVNRYLKECAGEEFTSKDFRTWAGTLLAARALRGREAASGAEARRELAQAVAEVARRLGNTPAVCRKCYIHPAIIEAYLDGKLDEPLRGSSERTAVIALLEPRHGPAGRARRAPRGSNLRARGTRLAAASHAVSS
jgi:DNA topoisomerase-1